MTTLKRNLETPREQAKEHARCRIEEVGLPDGRRDEASEAWRRTPEEVEAEQRYAIEAYSLFFGRGADDWDPSRIDNLMMRWRIEEGE
jgi:hypothetical protein